MAMGEQPDFSQSDTAQAAGAGEATVGARSAASTFVHMLRSLGASRLLLGLVAVAMAAHAQSILTPKGRPIPNADTATATRWYVVAAGLLVMGWLGSYSNISLLRLPISGTHGVRAWIGHLTGRQLLLTSAGVAANVMAILLLRNDWYSRAGGLLWVASMALILLACAGERDEVCSDQADVSRGWMPGRILETTIVVSIIAVALVMRLWRLGDLSPGMHGDEGEAGTQALAILNGNPVSPFMRGWFNQPNLYYWSLAICMKVFGSGLFGLRSFAVICGMLAVIFTYLIAREMFGIRAACIAGFFIAFQSAALLFSRQEFSNVTVPPLQAGTFYFVVRGLRTRRHVDFAVAGLLSGIAWYFFAGGRLIGPVAAMFFAYLAVTRRAFLRAYWTRVAAFFLAMAAMVSPFVAYYLAYPVPSNTYPNDRFIWLHHDELAALYGTTSWISILWHQLENTFAILALGADVSAMAALDYPITRPLEATLVILGLAWAFWRLRDSRFFLLSLWFWSSLVAGGVLTIGAPNLPRILGILPVLAILIAVMLDQFWLLIADAVRKLGTSRDWATRGIWAGGIVVAAATLFSAIQNKQMYIDAWLGEHTNTVVTGQAMYVYDHGVNYFYYDMGAPDVYWTHGDNRFINPYAVGIDAVNMPNLLPLINNGSAAESDANFLIWPNSSDYLQVIQAYYPEGREQIYALGDPTHLTSPIVGYIVPHQVIDRHRTLLARYTSIDGTTTIRRDTSLGVTATNLPPADLSYPARASWDGAIVAPAYDRYRFTLQAPAGASLTIDGVTVFPTRNNAGVSLILAQGPHRIHLSARLDNPHTLVALRWSSSLLPESSIQRRYLWDDHIGRAWVGQIRPFAGSGSNRIDGFLGFRSANIAFGPATTLTGTWRSILTAHRSGTYTFELNAFSTANLLIDGRPVIRDIATGTDPSLLTGQALLSPGKHRLEVQYTWNPGVGYLELRWAPPGGTMQLLITRDLTPPGPGLWRPDANPNVAPPPSPLPSQEPGQPQTGPLIEQG